MGLVSDYLDTIPEPEMTHLDNLTKSQQEALLDVLCLAVYADGEALEEEFQVLAALVAEIPSFSTMDSASLREGLKAAAGRVLAVNNEARANALLRSIGERLDTAGLRETAFGMAVVVCLADGVVLDPERTMLGGLITTMGLDKVRVMEIIKEAQSFVNEEG